MPKHPAHPARVEETGASALADENAGLAGKLIELRQLVEEHRKLNIRDLAETKTVVARLEQRVTALGEKLDRAIGDIDRRGRELDQRLRDGAEQVRASGELARKMTDQMRVLEELRELATDPHEVVKPLRRDIGQLTDDLATLRRHVDAKFEALPRARSTPLESRGADEIARREKYDAEQRRGTRGGAA